MNAPMPPIGRPQLPAEEIARRDRAIREELLGAVANLKAAAAALGIHLESARKHAYRLGFGLMYVTRAERRHLLERRRCQRRAEEDRKGSEPMAA